MACSYEESDIVGPAATTEDVYLATCLTANTGPTIRKLAALSPAVLALMHGPAFRGNGQQALNDLAGFYEQRFQNSLA